MEQMMTVEMLPTSPNTLELTDRAEAFLKRLLRFSGVGSSGGVRIAVSGGCSGLTPNISIESSASPGDATVMSRGMRVFLAADSLLVLNGATIDFLDTPTHTGLVLARGEHAAGASQGHSCGGSCGPTPLVTPTKLIGRSRRETSP
jgi:iron-sulfur cluster assembly protein